MPLSLLTVRGLGVALLRSPTPPRAYRQLLAQGLGPADAGAAPDSLIEALRHPAIRTCPLRGPAVDRPDRGGHAARSSRRPRPLAQRPAPRGRADQNRAHRQAPLRPRRWRTT